MSEIFRRLSPRMWGDADFRKLSGPQPNARDLWIYLLTGLHTNPIPGLSTTTKADLAERLKWPMEGFQKALSELLPEGSSEVTDEGSRKVWFEADWDAGVIWIPKSIYHNEPSNPNVLKGWGKHYGLIPECELKDKAYWGLRSFAEGKSKAFLKAFVEGFGDRRAKPFAKGSRKQEQEQKQEQKQEKREREAPADQPVETSTANTGKAGDERTPPAESAPLSALSPLKLDLFTAERQAIVFQREYERVHHTLASMGGKQVGEFHAKVVRTAEIQQRDAEQLFVEALSTWLSRNHSETEKRAPYACFCQAWSELTSRKADVRDVRRGFVEPAPASAYRHIPKSREEEDRQLDSVFGPETKAGVAG